jgi:2-aminoadipate transaminase
MEDDAYGELCFGEPHPPSKLALADEEVRQWIVYVSSYSKSLAPGLRLAWLSASPEFSRHVAVVKQSSDTHAGTLSQIVASHYLNTGSLEPALSRMRMFYERHASAMQRAITDELRSEFDAFAESGLTMEQQ